MISRPDLINKAKKKLEDMGFTVVKRNKVTGSTPLGAPIINTDLCNPDNVDLIITKEEETYKVAVRPAWEISNKKNTFRFTNIYKPYPDIIFVNLARSDYWVDLPGDFCKDCRTSNKSIPQSYTRAFTESLKG